MSSSLPFSLVIVSAHFFYFFPFVHCDQILELHNCPPYRVRCGRRAAPFSSLVVFFFVSFCQYRTSCYLTLSGGLVLYVSPLVL